MDVERGLPRWPGPSGNPSNDEVIVRWSSATAARLGLASPCDNIRTSHPNQPKISIYAVVNTLRHTTASTSKPAGLLNTFQTPDTNPASSPPAQHRGSTAISARRGTLPRSGRGRAGSATAPPCPPPSRHRSSLPGRSGRRAPGRRRTRAPAGSYRSMIARMPSRPGRERCKVREACDGRRLRT